MNEVRLIDAEALKAEFKKMENYHSLKLPYDVVIDNAPTVEQKYYERVIAQINPVIEARPQGEWIEENTETGALGIKYTWFKCSQCGWDSSLVIPKNFCPNCGADMRGKDENQV